MSDNYYADLRALAEAANVIQEALPATPDPRWREKWDAYIDATNPARILALLTDLDAARAEVERLQTWMKMGHYPAPPIDWPRST